jgi:cysteine synthase
MGCSQCLLGSSDLPFAGQLPLGYKDFTNAILSLTPTPGKHNSNTNKFYLTLKLTKDLLGYMLSVEKYYNTLNPKEHQNKTENCIFYYNDLFDFLTCFSIC